MGKSVRKQTSIKVDPIAWENAKEIFNEYGISVSDAINIFLNKVRLVGGLPFEMRKEPTTSKEEIIASIKSSIEEVNSGKLHNKEKTLDEFLNEL
jgi:DNA-damage-inducible protein J